MTRFTHFTTGCSAFALAGFVSVGAQTPQSTSPSTMQQSSRQEVTAVGCLKTDMAMSGTASAGSTASAQTGASASATSATRYKLEDARITAGGSGSSAMSGHTAGSSGSTATSGSTGSTDRDSSDRNKSGKDDKDISLMAATSSVNLAEHLNKQVEVRGMWHSGSMSSAGSTSATGSTGSTGSTGTTGSTMGASDRDHGKTLNVTSVRMIASTCSN